MNTTINKIYTYCLITTLIASSVGCTGFEDVNPSEEFPGSEVGESTYNLELVLNEGYGNWAQMICQQHLPSANLIADYTEALTGSQALGGSYEDLYEFDRGGFQNDGVWSNAYDAINQANLVLDFTNTTDPIDELYLGQRDRLRGEAWFLRAYSYFTLIRYYGKQFTASDANMPGVVLRTTPATGFASGGRVSVLEVYNQIFADLDSASQALPAVFKDDDDSFQQFPEFQYRAKKFDVLALKARAQFQKNDMTGCQKTLFSLIGQVPGDVVVDPSLMPDADFAMAPDSETILDYFRSADLTAELRASVANFTISEPFGLMTSIDGITDSKQSKIYLTEAFINLYLDVNGIVADNDDFRMNNFVVEEIIEDDEGAALDTVYIFNKFLLDAGSNTNWPTIRLEELLLMRAESWALDGQSSAAIKDINYLRSLRGTDPLPTSLSRIELINAIAKDRMLEMVGEGERFFNWKRMGAYNASVESVYGTAVYNTFDRPLTQGIAWDSEGTLFRIPQNEITRNTDMTDADQNP